VAQVCARKFDGWNLAREKMTGYAQLEKTGGGSRENKLTVDSRRAFEEI
jgi:hypothetical protein